MKNNKILLIGVGSVGRRHLQNLIKLGYSDISLVDSNVKSLESYRGKHKCFKSAGEAFKNGSFDVAFICSPTDLHLKQAYTALANGCHLFIEKPISNKLEGISKLKSLARGKIVMVGANWRFNKAFLSFEKFVTGEKYGRVLYLRIAAGYYLPKARPNVDFKKIYASQKNGGGVMLDTGSHVVNYLNALFGNLKRGVYLKNQINHLKIQSEEISHLILEYQNGVTCDISFDYVSKKPVNRIEAVCKDGLLTLDLVGNQLVFEDESRRKVLFDSQIDTNQMFIDELKHFFSCVSTGRKPMQDISDAEEILNVLLVKCKEV